MSVSQYIFGKTKNGEEVIAYELKNDNGMAVRVLNLGCAIQSVVLPDRNGKPTDVVLGYDDVSSYENGTCYYGAVVGRYANRIADARFILDGKEYLLDKTSENKLHHLHGVYHKRLFNSSIDGDAVVFKYLSPDGEEKFPGNLSVEVRYSLKEDNSIELSYLATTDAPTVINLTNHCYFNLNGQDGSTVLSHKVRLSSSYFTEYTDTFAQTGRIIPVEGTPLDFRKERTIGALFDDNYPQFRACTGYDHNMVLDGDEGELKRIGEAKSDKTGIKLEAFTTEPAIQFYSANFIHFDEVKRGKNGVVYPKNGGFCFEAQHYPDSIRHKHFPNVILRPNEKYTQKTIYKLGVDDE